jgi:hypothetical protein
MRLIPIYLVQGYSRHQFNHYLSPAYTIKIPYPIIPFHHIPNSLAKLCYCNPTRYLNPNSDKSPRDLL